MTDKKKHTQTAQNDSQPLENEADNPLLESGVLPAFDRIAPHHVAPAVRALVKELSQDLEALESEARPSWSAIIEPLERINDRLQFAWGVVGHLMGVKNSESLREAHESAQPEVVAFGLRVGQSRPIFQALSQMRDGIAWGGLDEAQQRIVESLLRDMRHAGVGLEGKQRERFNAIQHELAEICTRFSNNVLDATKAWALELDDVAEVEGLPRSLLELAAQGAREEGHERATPDAGPWRITLDTPSFFPFMEHSRRRDLREKLYRAYVSRAGQGEFDNTELIDRILMLRDDEASLLGYASYAELSLASKMASSVRAVESLLEELRSASAGAARRDLDDIRAYAMECGAPEADDIQLWDVAFWSERLREHNFDYSEEDLRPYFPLPRVLEGLFGLAERLFGIRIIDADGDAPVWHPDVRYFRVRDEAQREIAGFYLDPYSRPAEKRGGAWMDECVGRSRVLAPRGAPVRLPVAYLVCNQTPPIDDKPSLMTFSEVTTLFHEFGHGLQHMLTTVDEGLASGIRNIEWDAVELPSQFMENWCYDRDTIRRVSSQVQSGEPIPDFLFDKVCKARTFRAGSDMLRQLYFGFTDLELHHHYQPGADESVFDVQRRVAERTAALPPLPEDRFLCSFGHIFAGGYAAGYYSYKWAEVLSADAFAAFEEAGLDDPERVAETGRRFRETVLASGGSQAPMKVFKAFRGRPPSSEALLRHSGLASDAETGG